MLLTQVEPLLNQAGWRMEQGLQLFDAATFATMHHPPLNPDTPTLLLHLQRENAAGLQHILLNQYPAEFNVILLDGATAQAIPLNTLSTSAPDAAALFIPAPEKYTSFEAFQEIIAHLRAPEGCPWDRKQTHASLRQYLVEETYETLDAIDNEEWGELAGELGDLLLQIVLHTQIATEHGEFQMRDVLRYVNTKMIRRHPHVWGDVSVDGDANQVVANWEDIKRAEQAQNGTQKRESILDGIPKGLPALSVAHKFQDKAAKVGFDWDSVQGVEAKVHEELGEIFAETDPAKKALEIGDLIFVLVNWLRWLNVDDSETILRAINAKFYRRFRYVEEHAPKPLKEMTLTEMDALWDAAKAQGL
jgi:tetrapyrrole methylase family protein / MazG family protein